MKTATDWVVLVVGILTIGGLISGVVVFVRASYSKAKIESLQQDNTNLRAEVADLDRRLERERTDRERHEEKVKAESEQLKAQLEGALTQNQMLADMILQRANIEAVHDQIDQHHQEAKQAWTSLIDEVKKIKQSNDRLIATFQNEDMN